MSARPLTSSQRQVGLGLAMAILTEAGPKNDPEFDRLLANLRRWLKARAAKRKRLVRIHR
jgi:hypothetical protein